MYLLLCNDCKQSNVNTSVAYKIYMSHTISSVLLCHLFLHFYTMVHGTPPPCLRRMMLWVEDTISCLLKWKVGISTLTFRYYTGIHECCQCEIGYNEECYDSLICSDPHINCVVNIPLAARKKKTMVSY